MANQIGGTIVWNLDVDDSKFQSGLNKAKSQASDFGKHVDKEFSGIRNSITSSFEKATQASQIFATGLGIVAGAIATASGFGIKYAADLETMTQGFITLLGSADKANEAISMIQKDAAQTPFEFKGLVDANFMLTSVTKNAQRSEGLLLNIGKALTASGKSGAELDRIIVNLQQIANVGKITELDIRQFGFAGINILELLADYYGTTKEAASDMIKNSTDAFKDLEGAFEKAGTGGGRFARAFIDQAGTFNQLWSNFVDNLGITASQLVKQTGLFDAVKGALKGVVGALSFFASPEGTAKILEFFNTIQQNAPIIIGILIGGLAPAFWALAAPIIASTLHLLPFIAAGFALGAVAQFLIGELGGWGKVMEGLRGVFQSLGKAYDTYLKPGIDALVKEIKTNLLPALQELWTTIKPVLIPALKLIGTVIAGAVILWLKAFIVNLRLIVGVVTFVAKAITGLIKFFIALPGAISAFVSEVGANISALGTATSTGFQTALTTFITFLQSIPIAVGTFVNNVVMFFQALPGRIASFLIQTGLRFVEFLGFLTGLVIYGVPLIVENMVTFFTELPGKLMAIFTQIYTDISLTFTNIAGWLATNVPLMIDSVVNFFLALPGRIVLALGYVLGVIVQGFTNIWNWLSAVVPQIIETVINFFATLPERIGAWLTTTKERTSSGFMDIWNAIIAEISTWPGRLYEWGANIANAFVDGIKSAIGRIVDAFKGGLDKAKAYVEGKSPPIAGPFKNIDKWGFNIGMAWVDGMREAIGGLSFDNPFNTGIPAVASAPAVASGSGSRGIDRLVNIEHMEIRDESDINDVARQLGFIIETSTGYTQNG